MENKTGKYFKYAVGEIILVVIGILIALQINNWNNERIDNESEAILLNQLEVDLIESKNELKNIQSFYLFRTQASAKVLNAFWEPKHQNDSIEKYITRPLSSRIYSPILGTAKSLINSGNIDLISSVELKNSIISYVEKVEYTLKDIQRYEETYYRNSIYDINKMIPNTIRSIEYFNKRAKSDSGIERRKFLDSLGINYIPTQVESIPFKSDLKTLFLEEKMYNAYYKLYLSHRNVYSKYNNILDYTTDLLEKVSNDKIL